MDADPGTVELLLSLGLGIGLAAACGFRIFVPLLVASAAALTGHLELTPSLAWIGTRPALIAFAAATVAEVAGYYVPWVDNVLDALGAPLALVAGTLVSASVFTEVDPMLRWILAAIAGGGAAGAVHGTMALLRQASSLTTGGLANPLVSTAEMGGSLIVAVLAILVPLLALLLLVAAAFAALRFLRRRRRAVAS
jgi:hypothetical protein